jgi:hypothetical protein
MFFGRETSVWEEVAVSVFREILCAVTSQKIISPGVFFYQIQTTYGAHPASDPVQQLLYKKVKICDCHGIKKKC